MKRFFQFLMPALALLLLGSALLSRVFPGATEALVTTKKVLVARLADLDPFLKTQAEGHGSKKEAR
ncbi:MAG TPA: hypothetical protein PKE49_11905 [Leptospiraceae bacterium]|jgi:hypothetical protein|nr:hypothetical protein [Leptospirales bacterium]HMU83706.1 hypothetical protein [Leptospiraceae bacterium]HMW59171.1 hypothetical protein [Leptospiraceae bacterium]HMX57222.1 hypothetical protein [Leptospiraceae bacterium]HMY47468.1 hypothetical protein [Leptospiraceae bacterium]